jgi:hypothetical protein
LYNISDLEIEKICDGIIKERDAQLKTTYTKAILFFACNPTMETYFGIAKQILVQEEYDLIVTGIYDPDVYKELAPHLKLIVDFYFEGSAPK